MTERTLMLDYDLVHAWIGAPEGDASILDESLWKNIVDP